MSPASSRPASRLRRAKPSRTPPSVRRAGGRPPRVEAERLRGILRGLREEHPEVRCALEHRSAFQLLAATILSAQCTDTRVNQVTPELFRRYPTPSSLAAAPRARIEELIRTTGFFRSKARSLQEMSLDLETRFGGEVPRSLDALVDLQGVGRKTANVVLGTAFGIPSGVVVDTHVKRISRRLGLTHHDDPVRIERDLMQILPRKGWIDFSHRVIWHGRRVCKAIRPRCETCTLAPFCPTGEKELRRRARSLTAPSPPSRRKSSRQRVRPVSARSRRGPGDSRRSRAD
ncbi:MAG: endonuclease III [Acidobacteriota bacterium]|nr:endonuclease III [Acidobacteriota bacterium]